MASSTAGALDPSVATREQFTRMILDKPSPAGAHAKWSELHEKLKRLLSLLAYDDAMKENLQQPYMQPANEKNIIYFMWDFVGRTLSMLEHLDPKQAPETSPRWSDVGGRLQLANLIIQDKTGRMGVMIGAGGDNSNAFSKEIEEAAAEVAKP